MTTNENKQKKENKRDSAVVIVKDNTLRIDLYRYSIYIYIGIID